MAVCFPVLMCFTGQNGLLANPMGGEVVSGQASFNAVGNTLTVTNTPGAIINWQGFSINTNEVTHFAQQTAASAVLNRVVTNNPSVILGTLSSNGQVFLVNPGGIVFGAGSTVDVAGLVATSLNLSDADFLAGRHNFTSQPGAQNISNAGSITAQQGGQIYLIAPNVENTGVITAPNGEILLAAGHEVQLVNSLDPGLRVSITAPAGDATNLGRLIVESGSLGLFGTVVKNTGIASADSATMQGGKIVFKASQRAEVGGTVSANGTTGGTIQTLGNEVGIMDGASISANGEQNGGTVLVGGDYQGKNPDVQNAQVTYVAPTANISANAIQNGNGGKVIVWADDTARIYGSISATGGAEGGNGGFVETSGKRYLNVTSAPNVFAPAGRGGQWLLDPHNVTIQAGPGNMDGIDLTAPYFIPAAADNSTLDVAVINAALNAETTIEVTTGGTGVQLGTITVAAPITKTAGVGAGSLFLTAANEIFINADITASSGQIQLFTAATQVDVNANITLNGGSWDATGGGATVRVDSGAPIINSPLYTGAVNISAGTATFNGNIFLTNLTLSGGTLTGTGAISIPNTGTLNWTNGVIGGNGTLTTQAGSTTTLSPGFAQTVALNGSRVWNNSGAVTFTPNSGTLSYFQIDDTAADGTAVFNNLAGGQFNINASFNDTHTIGVGTFNNAGTLNKNLNGAAAISGFAPAFNNQVGGVVNVNSGTLRFDTGGTDAGNYVLTNSAILQFHGGPRSISGNIGGTGNVTFSKPLTATAVYTLTGDYNISGTTTAALDSLGTGTLAFNGTVTNLGTSYIQSGGVTNVSFTGMTSGAATGFQNLVSIAVNDGSVTFANGTNFSGLTGLTQAGSGVLDFGNNSISVNALNMTSGTLTGSGNVTVTTGGSFNWGGSLNATIAGSGTLTTQSGVTTNITPGFARTTSLRGSRVWNNSGTVTFTPNSGTLSFFQIDDTTADGTAVFNNLAGGQFNINASFNDTHTIGVGTFNNAGTLNKNLNGAAATSGFAPAFNNQVGGVVNVNSGTLTITGALTQSGLIEVAAGATFLKTGGFSNSITGTLAGAGTISVGTGNSLGNNGTISPGMTVGDTTGTLSIVGNLSMGASSILNIDINSPLAGDYDVLQLNPGMAGNLAGTLNLSGVAPAGSYSIFSSTGGMFGTFATVNSGTFTQTPTYDTGNQLVTLTVTANTNAATAYWTGIAADFNWATAGNWSSGIAPIAGDKVYIGGGAGTVSYTPTAGQVGTIISDGALNFVAGDLTVANASTFRGAVSFNGSTLALTGGGTFGSVSVDSGTSTLTGTVSANSLNVNAGSLTLGGASTVNKMNMAGGTLTDNFGLAINGSFNWSGGTITSANGSIFTTSSATTTTITGNATMVDNIWQNAGTVNFNGTGNLSLGGAGVAATIFTNQAGSVVNLNSSSATPIQWATIATNKSFANAGTLSKNGGSAATQTLDLLSGNAGTVKVQSGILALPNLTTNDGTISVASGATFSTGAFTNSYYWNGSIWVTGVLEGAGTINAGAGTITNNGIIAPGIATGDATGTLSIAGNLVMGATGQLNFDLDGVSAGNYDVLAISGTANITTANINLKGFSGTGAYAVLTTGGLTGTGTINSGYFTQIPTYTANNLSLGVTGNLLANAITWDGGAGTYNWADALNWSANVLPTSTDNVYIATLGANSLLINLGVQPGNNLVCDANFQLTGGGLTLGGASYFNGTTSISGGTFNTTGAAQMGTLNWTGGTITGAGVVDVSSLNMPAGSTFNGINATNLNGKTMNVNGNTSFSSGAANGSNGADLTLLNGAIVNNKGIWSIDNFGNIIAGAGGGTFNNFGEMRIGQTVAATATINTVFNNDNTIFIDLIHGANINNGSLTISGGGTSIFDSFNTLAGATIGFTNGYVFNVATDFGTGTLNLAGGTVNATGALSAGTINISGPVTSNGNLTLQAVSGINQGFGSSITANGIVTISSSAGMIDLPAITSTVTGLPGTTAAINVDATNSWLFLSGHLTTTSGGIRLTASGLIDLDNADNYPTLVTAAGDVFIQSVNNNIGVTGRADISGANVVLNGLSGVDTYGTTTATGSVQAVSANGSIFFRDATSAVTGVSVIAGGNITLTASSMINTGTGALNLTATGNLNIAGSISAGIFTLNGGTWNQVAATLPGFTVNDFRIAGGTFIRALGGNGTAGSPYQLADIYGVQGMGSVGMLGNSYVLANNIDATGTVNWNAGAGFAPIGGTPKFSGSFDGQNNTIANLFINRPNSDYVGLFGDVSGTISNVGLLGGSVSGKSVVGGLAGQSWGGAITNSYNTGSVTSPWSACCNGIWVGGLVGVNNGSITNSYATGNVFGYYHSFGGLVGSNSGSIASSYATGNVTSGNNVGGLAGSNNGSISNSYATGAASAINGFNDTVGGLVGANDNGSISNSYASGAVTGSINAGGLAGRGNVSSSVVNSFWNTATSGQATSVGGTGLTTAQMMQMASFTGWNIASTGGSGAIWRIYEGSTAPLLRNFLKPLTITADPVSATYTGVAYAGALVNPVYNPASPNLAQILGSAYSNAVNAGNYTPARYSTQQGYDISYVGGVLTINPTVLSLNVTANNASKTYGTTLTFAGTEFTPVGLTGGDTISGVTLTSAGATNTASAGTYAITPSNAVFSVGSASNYIITYVDGVLTVTPAPLTITADIQSKIYGNTDPALTYVATGLLFSDTLTGGLNRAIGENVGTYAINQGSLSNSNYTVTFNSNNLSITPRDITIAVNPATKTYGQADNLTFTVGNLGLASWDTNAAVSSGLTRAAGENVGTYAIIQGVLSNTNYNLTGFTGNNLTISAALLTVAGVPANKVLGTPDPLLTYTTSGLQFSDTEATVLNGGSLMRDPGETIGTYLVNQGTLALLSTNYTMTYLPCNFTILAPTVVQEITQISMQNTPHDDTATTTAEEDEKKQAAQAAAEAEVVVDAGGAMAEPLPVCQ